MGIHQLPEDILLYIFEISTDDFLVYDSHHEDALKPYRRIRHPVIICIQATCRSWNILATCILKRCHYTYLPLMIRTTDEEREFLQSFVKYRNAILSSYGSKLHFDWTIIG